jgi:3-phenylpropionate/trans-cinnamate dioxygenase ferredoxin subunit
MVKKGIKWFKVAESENELLWGENNLLAAEINGKPITLAKVGDRVYACAYKCPHASGVLAGGYIDAVGHIVCPLHRYKFDLRNGRNVSGEGYYLKTYGVQIREDGVYVGLEENNWFEVFN